MTTTPDELMKDAQDFDRGHDVEVACLDCGDALLVRFRAGEPEDQSSMCCHCGGELEEV